MNEDLFTVITWPDVQDYMSLKGWEENSCLVNSDALYEEYGDSAYFVRTTWLNSPY